MRDEKRIPVILENLRVIWEENPDLRLGQLLGNLKQDLYNIEDEELMGLLCNYYYGLCGCGYANECGMHCNHERGFCPGKSYHALQSESH